MVETWYALIDRDSGLGTYQVTATSFGTFCSDPANDGLPCDDESSCTSGEICQGGACVGTAVPDGTGCDDGNACSVLDSCQSGVCVGQSTCGDGVIHSTCEQCDDGGTASGDGCDSSCAVESCYVCDSEPSVCGAPTGCATAGRGVLVIKDSVNDDRDKIVWKWLKGSTAASAFGDPSSADGFELCLWEEDTLIGSAGVAAGGQCDGRPCWRALGPMIAPTGYKFKAKSSNADGVFQVLMKSGSGRGKILWKGRGSKLSLPGSASAAQYVDGAALTVQALRDDRGACWESEFDAGAFKVNAVDRLKAVQ